MDLEEDYYDSLEEDDEKPKETNNNNSKKGINKSRKSANLAQDAALSNIVPLYQGDKAKDLVKPTKTRRRKPTKQLEQTKEEPNELKSVTLNKLAILKDIKPSKSYLDMFYAKIGYPEKKNGDPGSARAVIEGDLTERSNFSVNSKVSFVSETDSFYIGVIKKEEYIVPPLELKANISRGSSFVTTSTISLNSSRNKNSDNLKIIKKISSNVREANSGSEIFLRKAVADMQVSSWKKRQQYGKIASEKNKIRLKELKALKELDVK